MAARRFEFVIVSPLKGVTASAWEKFYRALDVQPVDAVSPSGGLGSYDIRPRRLVELGYANGLVYMKKNDSGRYVHTCDFILPWTQARFLADPVAQLAALAQSMRLYREALLGGRLKKPEDASMAGALAVLHRGGRGALEAWPKLFDDTRALVERVKGLF